MKLSSDQVRQRLTSLDNWELADGKIRRSFKFRDFKEAMDFVNKVADEAEEMDHHPDIYISYNKLELELITHSEGGLTDRDFTLAQKINQLLGV
jgi:4a-hydroxytetrahydrobiopterin dehydratase